MKTSYSYLLSLCLSILMTACADDSLNVPLAEPAPQIPITLSAAYPTASRASDAGFENGDEMGVYVLDYVDGNPQQINAGDIHAGNVRFRFNATDNSWTGATNIYWTSNSTPADIVGYYPFNSAVDDPLAVPFSISRRQDFTGSESELGGYEASDFLWAKVENVMPTTSRVDLTLRHIMAGVRVTLCEGSGFAVGEWENLDKTVLVSNIIPSATVNLSTGEVSVGTNTPVSVTPYEYNGEWRAVVVPQTVAAGAVVVAVSVDGVGYSLIKTEAMTYLPGKLHTFTINVNRNPSTGDYEFIPAAEAITAWIDDVEFRDGIMREYVIVNVPEKGSLSTIFRDLGIVNDEVINLKLNGEIDQNDYTFIRENLNYIKSLNLYDTETYSGGNKSVIPDGALAGKSTLNHIIFPKNLTVIGNRAFSGCGLMGDLIIPEGVTHIGTGRDLDNAIPGHSGGGEGAFSYCASLVGTLTLPGTLEFIESGAFCRAPLTGELRIPKNVKFIGSIAFDSSKFTGSLSLPEHLEEMGTGAFFGVPLSGELRIPQGIKVIRNQTFFRGNYSLISLPEGLLEIGSEAFIECDIRGELKLPSTLKILGNKSFAGNKISNIIFPENLVYMGYECFMENSRLSGTIEIPKRITAINRSTFARCSLLDEVIIGDNITKIEDEAFGGCYNLTSIVVNNPEPPLLTNDFGRGPFHDVSKDNFTVQVPENSVELYRQAPGWKEFKRIAAYSNFVCRPATACALTTRHQESLIIDSDGEWEISHMPDWCDISKTSGVGKTELILTINEMAKGAGNRSDYVEFALKGTDFTTKCTVKQYDYQYGEDECVTLQSATKGNGIDILFLADGFDGEAISSGKYLELVNQQTEAFFGIEPYTTYRDYFNVYACISLSQENGVNTANTWRNTRFTTLYALDCFGVGHLIHDDVDAVFDYAVEFSPLTSERMPVSLIIMTLNSDEYGGSTTLTDNGSAISICSPSSDPYPMDTRGIVQHEACGHGFGKLADERISHNAYIPRSNIQEIVDAQQWHGWYQNVSITGKIPDVPWSHFVFDPRYSDKVDVFEGAYGYTRGVFRSEINSCMNYGIPYFNAISRQDIMRRILDYSGDGFSMDKFYATDTDRWGQGAQGRAIMPAESESYTASGLHHPVRIVKSNKY